MKAPDCLEDLRLDYDENDLVVMQGDEKRKITINVRFITTRAEDALTKLFATAPTMAAALQCPDLDAAHDAFTKALGEPVNFSDKYAVDCWRVHVISKASALSLALSKHHESRRQALLAAGFTEEVAL